MADLLLFVSAIGSSFFRYRELLHYLCHTSEYVLHHYCLYVCHVYNAHSPSQIAPCAVMLSVCLSTQLQVCPLSVCCQFVWSQKLFTHTHTPPFVGKGCPSCSEGRSLVS